MRKKFKKKSLGSIHNIRSLKEFFTSRVIIKTIVILACIAIIFMVSKWAWTFATQATKSVGKSVTKIASKNVGEELVTDAYGNINFVIAGYAGEEKRGGFLTDTIMMASYNPDEAAITFLSIPRDLYVEYGNGARGKMNSLYWAMYIENGDDHDAAAKSLAKKVSEITGIETPYYAVVSFKGFVEFIDSLDGIDIKVPYTLHDVDYPGPNDTYETFHIDQGRQSLDGETALKYARSRKSTSDFSRALRQQQIIEGSIKKLTGSLNISKMMDTYENLDSIVKTNMSGKQMLWLGQFMDQEKHYFSYVYTAECDLRYIDLTEPGCVLRYGDRGSFNGLSVMLPEGAGPSNLSYFKNTQDFAFWVVHNQSVLKESAEITVLNGIDTQAARAAGYRIEGVATKLGQELILRGFDIDRVGNDKDVYEETFLVIPGNGWFPETVETLSAFVDYTAVVADPLYGSGVTIILGDDYLKNL